jgi:hypothetical protein
VTGLDFLSPDRTEAEAGFEPIFRSPLERALRRVHAIDDLSHLGKLEVRGEIDGLDVGPGELVPITTRRALVLCDGARTATVRERLREQREHVFDVTAALAGMRLHGERLLRRLTDLDLDALPAAGAVARVPAVVLRDGDEFRIFFPQEYGHSMAEAAIDAAAGL